MIADICSLWFNQIEISTWHKVAQIFRCQENNPRAPLTYERRRCTAKSFIDSCITAALTCCRLIYLSHYHFTMHDAMLPGDQSRKAHRNPEDLFAVNFFLKAKSQQRHGQDENHFLILAFFFLSPFLRHFAFAIVFATFARFLRKHIYERWLKSYGVLVNRVRFKLCMKPGRRRAQAVCMGSCSFHSV